MTPRNNSSSKGGRGPEREAKADIGIAGLFRGLGNFVEFLGQMAEAGEHIAERSGEFDLKGLGDKARGVYGVRVQVGLGGETKLQSFGNIKPTERGPEIVDVREPLIDVFDEANEVIVVSELPGASDKSIQIEISGDILKLSSTGERRYAKEVLLPCAVDEKTIRRSYKNGLLEIRVTKA